MLSAAEVSAAAEKRAGIADTEQVFRPNLEHLVAALNSDNQLTALGEASARKTLVDRTADRLEGIKWLAKYPEIGDEVIAALVFLAIRASVSSAPGRALRPRRRPVSTHPRHSCIEACAAGINTGRRLSMSGICTRGGSLSPRGDNGVQAAAWFSMLQFESGAVRTIAQ